MGKCPWGHGELTEFETPEAGSCSMCGVELQKGASMYGCILCSSYNLCVKCSPAPSQAEAEPSTFTVDSAILFAVYTPGSLVTEGMWVHKDPRSKFTIMERTFRTFSDGELSFVPVDASPDCIYH